MLRCALLSLLAVPCLAQRPAANATPSAWLQLGNTTTNMGVVPASLDVTWAFKAQRPVRGISVAEGIVILGTESADADAAIGKFSKDQRGFVTALDALTGKELWTHSVSNWIHGDPAIYKGRVYVTYGSWPLTTQGGVIAYDLHTGDSIWHRPTVVGNMTAPLVDTVTQSLIIAGGEGVLYQLSLADGSIKKEFGLRAPVPMSSPRLGGRDVYVGGTRSLSSYSLDKQALNWRSRSPATFGMGNIPVALNDQAAFTSGITFYGLWRAFRALPFRQFWAMAKEAYGRNAFSTRNTWFQQLWIIAYSRADGHVLWRKPLGLGLEVPRNTAGTPTVAGNRVLVSSPHSRSLHAFDATTGNELWTKKLDAMQKGSITVIGDDAILGDRNSVLTIYKVTDGSVLGQCKTSGPFTVLAPVIVGKTLFVATKNGWVHAAPYETVRRRALKPGVRNCF